MQKSMLIALGVVIALSTLVVLVDDDVDAVDSTPELLGIEGTGTESDPYQVDTADDLNVIDELSTAMRAGTSIHVVLVNDVDISGVEVNSGGDFIYGFRGTFDGNGYSITGASTIANYLFYWVYGGSSLTDIVLDTDSTFTMVLAQNDGDFLMSDITVEGWGTGTLSGGNESPFIAHTFGNLTMENCTNNADLVLGNYGAVFLGGYARGEGIEVTFRNCVNNGSILGSSPSLFIGNPWQTEIGVLTIVGCANNKDIIGTTNAKYIAAYSGTGYGEFFDDLNEACAKDSGTTTGDPTAWQEDGNYARVGTFSIEAIAGDGVPRTNTVDLTLNLSADPYSATTNEVSADHVVFTIGAYAQGNGTWMTTIVGSEVPISGGSANLNLSVGMLTTYELAKLEYQEVPTSPTGTTSNGFPYYQFSVNGTTVYAVDFGDAEWSFTDVTSVTIGVTLYAEDGSQLAYKHGNVGVTRPTPTVSGAESTTFHKVYVVNEDYVDVNLDSRYVADGTALEFTISPKAGYTLADEIIVKATSHYDADATNYKVYVVESLGNGSYRISSVDDDVYIAVSTSDGSSGITTVYHTISYDLSNVNSSSSVASLAYGAPFTTTLTAIGGYNLSDVTVTMGGIVLSDAYDSATGKVNIRNVTGDVVISASASSTSWGDDEDLPPFIPTQPAEDDNTVTIVACAAAAAVAAIMAVFLIIDRKG